MATAAIASGGLNAVSAEPGEGIEWLFRHDEGVGGESRMVDQQERIPAAARPAYDAIAALTDTLAEKHLDDEYAALFRKMAAALARKRPSPLLSGKPASWAAGIAHAVGRANFLDDRDQQPYMAMSDLFKALGVSQATGTAKSKLIRDMLGVGVFDPTWTRPSRLGANPLVWMIEVNGLVVDVRHAPPSLQEEAFRRGLIPYVPSAGGDGQE